MENNTPIYRSLRKIIHLHADPLRKIIIYLHTDPVGKIIHLNKTL